MTSTCKGVGPLGMPVTGLTEPYLETGNCGELVARYRRVLTGEFRVREILFSLSTLLRPPGAQRRPRLRGRPWADSEIDSRVAVYRVQAAARGPLDAFSPRHSSHPTMTIMLTPAAKASTSATVCLSDVLFCSRAGSTSTVAT